MEDNLPCQFHTRFGAWYLQKYVVINNLFTQVEHIFFDKSQCFGCVYCINSVLLYVLHHRKYIAICSINAIAASFDISFSFRD